MAMNKCLHCYKELDGEYDFHEKCALTFFGSKKAPALPYTIDQMAKLAKLVVERRVTVPGVQAKLSLSLIKEMEETSDSRLTVVGALGGRYILKPPVAEYPEMPQNEHLTMRIAELFGIRTVPSSLIRFKSGELAYMSKRVDRGKAGEKVHMIDMFQITEAFDKYRSSMEKVGKALRKYSDNTLLDSLFLFELTLFSFLTGNNDMHLKNFSMVESASGWVLSPAYDLLSVAILIPDDTDELALSMGGKKKKFTIGHFKEFGQGLGLSSKQLERVFSRFLKNKNEAITMLDNSFLSSEMTDAYKEVLVKRYERLTT